MDTASLYHGPLEDFVSRRTALARELRPTDPNGAAALGKLRKPPASAWAIDQLAAGNPALIAELLAAGADARDAQWSAAAGSVSREDLQVASGRLRDAVETAARAAIALLERDGHGTSDETSRRIRTTLQAAATGSAADRQTLWSGTLSGDLDVAGFGAIQEPEADAAEIAAVVASDAATNLGEAIVASDGPSIGDGRPRGETRSGTERRQPGRGCRACTRGRSGCAARGRSAHGGSTRRGRESVRRRRGCRCSRSISPGRTRGSQRLTACSVSTRRSGE